MFSKLSNYSYERMNVPDWMHNLSRTFVWIMKVLVGPNREGAKDDDAKHRKHSHDNGVFKDIWPDTPVYLDHHLASLLRGQS